MEVKCCSKLKRYRRSLVWTGNLRAVSREGSWPSPMAVLQETDSSSLEPFAIGNASVVSSEEGLDGVQI